MTRTLALQAQNTNLFDEQMSSHCSRCGFVETIYTPLLESLQVAVNTIPHLVLTNDIPMPMEATGIRDKITLMRRDLETLDDGIATIETLLKHLHRGRCKIASHLRSLESIVSPVRRLPFETLSQIFLDAMDVADKGRDSLDLAQVPMNLIHVSTVWRDVAVSLPQLWFAIIIKFTATPRWCEDDCSPMKFLALKNWLNISASHNYPISINVATERNASKLAFQRSDSLLSLLLSSSHHWRSARFECPPHFLPFISSLEGQLPLLEALHFKLYSLQLQAPMGAFSIAPSLCNVELDLISNQALLSLPWHQVTNLVLRRTANFFHILRRTPALEELLLDNCRAPYFDYELIHLRYLRKLDVRDDLGVVKYLVVPSLVEMSLSSRTSLHNRDTAEIVSQLHSHPEHRLTKLRIELDLRYFSDISALLSATPKVTHLTLVDLPEGNVNRVPETVLMSLTHHWQNASVIIPNLQFLEISFRCKFNVSHFIDMIESRWLHSPPSVNVTGLRSVRLVAPMEVTKSEAWRRLDILKDEGLAFFLEAL